MTERVVVWHNARCSKSRGACALLDEHDVDAEIVRYLDAMAVHPILIERPIVISGSRAVVARPAERVLDLLP